MQKFSRLALTTLPLLALLTLSSLRAEEQPDAALASSATESVEAKEPVAAEAPSEPAADAVTAAGDSVDETEQGAPTAAQDVPQEAQETTQAPKQLEQQEDNPPNETVVEPASTEPTPTEPAPTESNGAPPTVVPPPVDSVTPATAEHPAVDNPVDAEVDVTPAPIVDATPPHRAENVDLREVVLKPAAPAASTASSELAEPNEPPVVEPSEGSPLVLLGSEVPPSTAARLAWSPSESFAGIAAPTPVLVINGAQPGPVLCLTAAIHGDELVGIEVVRRVLYTVDAKQLSGALIGVPIVNLQGFRRGSRYLPDRRDLNRYFPGNTYGSSAARIAYSFFNEIVSKCDVLVDLHTGSFHRTNLPQVRADLNNADVASLSKGFGATAVLQSRGARGSLRRAAVEAGIPAVTLEAGEPMRLSEEPVEHGVRSVESLLDSLGMLKTRSIWSRREQPVFYKSTWVRANEGGVLMSKVRLGQRIEVGDLLGTVSDPITNAQHDIISPYAGRIIGMALNQVMMPGFAAYHIGIQASVEEAVEPDPTLDTAIDELDDEDAEPVPEAPVQSAGQPLPTEQGVDLPEDSE